MGVVRSIRRNLRRGRRTFRLLRARARGDSRGGPRRPDACERRRARVCLCGVRAGRFGGSERHAPVGRIHVGRHRFLQRGFRV